MRARGTVVPTVMNLLPRRAREVTPLSPGVESLLRSVPRVEVLHDSHGLRARLIAAHARGADAESRPPLGSALWVRFAIPATAAAAVVLGVGYFGQAPRSGRSIAMADSGVVSSPRPMAVRVVDDASIPMSSATAGLSTTYVGSVGDVLDVP